MKPEKPNDCFQVAEAIYYEVNPKTSMCVPNSAYLLTEKWEKEWIQSGSKLDLYDWIHKNKK